MLGEEFVLPPARQNVRLAGAAGTGCSGEVYFPMSEYWWWCFPRDWGYTHWFKHQLLFVCVHVFVVCRRVAGELFSVIFSLCSYPSFIFQTFLVLNQPCSATAREAVSLSCWACYKNTANDEPCTKSFQSLANLFTNAQLPVESGWLGKICFSVKVTNKTWSFDLQPE